MQNTGSGIIIIGGGVIGLCSAFYLKKQGYDVTVIDEGNITGGCSFGNAGYISPSHIVPLASPGIIAQGLKWMLSSTSPFYIRPRLNADLIRWGIQFYKSANAHTAEKNAVHLNNILMLSRKLMNDLNDELGHNFLMEEKGCFLLYKSGKTEKHELELAAKANKFGLVTEQYNQQQIQGMEPEVEVDVKGGILYRDDCHLHPGKFMAALKANLDKSGIRFLLNQTVTRFETRGNKINAVITSQEKLECRQLVLAAGSWLPGLSKKLGIHLLLQPGKGYSMSYENIERNLHYPAILVDERVAMTPMGNSLRMGGTMELSGMNNNILIKRVQSIFNAAKNYYPNLPVQFPAKEKIWSGLRPCTPDGIPYIGRHAKYNNLCIAGGHAMLGVSLAAATGKLVTEIIDNKRYSVDIKAFDPARFS